MDGRHKKKIVPPTEKEVMELLAAADRLANSKSKRVADSWKRYRPILYLAADIGARPGDASRAARHRRGPADRGVSTQSGLSQTAPRKTAK